MSQDNETPEAPSFKDVVKNPGLLEAFSGLFKKRDREKIEAAAWSDQEVTAAVRKFVFDSAESAPFSDEQQALVSLGARIHAPILAG